MLRYDVVDVFTDRPFSGNQLAVVHGTEGLADKQLLAIAREFNYSETSFPSQVRSDGYSVRIFTPGGELPFAGHPTLGTAWVLRESFGQPHITQRCLAGDVDVELGARVTLTAAPGDLRQVPDVDGVLSELGLAPEDLRGEAYLAGTGLTFLYLPVSDDAVGRARPPAAAVEYDGLRDPIGGIQVYAYDAGQVHARVFCPQVAVPEDAATGSAAAGLGLVLAARGLLAGGDDYVISQGAELGRQSTLYGSVTASGNACVGGEVQAIASGEIRTP